MIKYSNIIPDEYQRLEYIQKGSGDCWFDTQIVADPNDTEYEFSGGGFMSSAQIMNAATNTSMNFRLVKFQSSKKVGGNCELSQIISDIDGVSDFTAKINKNHLYINGTIVGTFPTQTTYLTYGNVEIFRGSYAGNTHYYADSGYIKKAIIRKSGIDVFYGIPCRRKSDNVLGLYDLVTQTLFTNSGDGSFTAGPDVDSAQKLKHRFITDANGNRKLVNKVYIGNNLVFEEPELVDMGLPSGTLWAKCNIDVTQSNGFAASPYQYDCSFFSWGNTGGHNPTSVSSFAPYNWGGVNETEPYYANQPYGSTPGNTLTGNIAVGEDFDAARANLGAPWRMPTNAEYGELFANIKYINADGTEVDTTKADKRVTVNGIVGLYIQSKINGARLFFSCSGLGIGTSRSNRGSNGYYWSSTWGSSRSARYLNFRSGGVTPQDINYRYYGFAVRAVQKL